jgi:hypothetical protein
MSVQHDGAHQDILRRLSILEGTALPPAPTPPPPGPTPGSPPPAGALATVDFLASPAPAGVSVVRSGTNATRRSGAATVEIMAANTLRYQYNSLGTLLGLMCEKARTNLLTSAIDPAASFGVLGTGVTETSNYGTAPNGLTQSTRLQVAAGNMSSGLRVGVADVDLARSVIVWLKGASAGSLYLRNPDTNVQEEYFFTTGWTATELYSSIALAGNWYNFDIVAANTAALDVQIWGTALIEGDTDVNTIVTSGTRAKEVVTYPVSPGAGTYDIRFTFGNGHIQDFTGVVVSGSSHTIDADTLNYPIIRTIAIYSTGTLPGTPSAPPPPPPSGGTDPAGFGPNQPLATVASFVETMTGDSDITAGPMEFPSQWSSGDGLGGHNYGGYIGDEGAGGMTNAQGQQRAYPWWVLCGPYYDNPEVNEVRAQIRTMRLWARTTSGAWFKPQSDQLDPAPGTTHEYQFSNGLNYNRVMPSGRQPVVASSGGRVIDLVVDWAPHGYPFGMYYPPFGEIDCLCFEIQARLVPKRFTNGGFRWATSELAINVGADWYTSSGWISEICHSGWVKLTNKWTALLAGTVKRPSGKPGQGPGLTVSQFEAAPISLPGEQNIWIERGTFNPTTNYQRLWLRRSAIVSMNKAYTVIAHHGTAVMPASNTVTILASKSYAAFDMYIPPPTPTTQQCIYVTDGATEDIWETFIPGSGSVV